MDSTVAEEFVCLIVLDFGGQGIGFKVELVCCCVDLKWSGFSFLI